MNTYNEMKRFLVTEAGGEDAQYIEQAAEQFRSLYTGNERGARALLEKQEEAWLDVYRALSVGEKTALMPHHPLIGFGPDTPFASMEGQAREGIAALENLVKLLTWRLDIMGAAFEQVFQTTYEVPGSRKNYYRG